MKHSPSRIFCLLLGFLLCLSVPLQAKAPEVQAQPPVWQVAGKDGGAVTMFGSVHLLPENVVWTTDKVREAAGDADIFVFEVPTDAVTQLTLAAKIRNDGDLPKGQSLRRLLPEDYRPKYDHVLGALGWKADDVDGRRPWLVSFLIDLAQFKKAKQTTPGPDFTFAMQARRDGKPMQYLETADEQVALIAPDDPAVELDYLKATLDGFDTAEADMQALTRAWMRGDAATIDRIIQDGFKGYPEEEARMFTDRNRRWVGKIAAMLKTGKRYFLVVGAGHLCGPNGVPALMKAEGYRVSGP